MTALGGGCNRTARDKVAADADFNNAEPQKREVLDPNISKNPFLTDISDTVKAGVVNAHGGRADNRRSINPFVVSMELTRGANGAAVPTLSPRPDAGWPLTPPPSGSTNPFTQLAAQQREGCGEFVTSPLINYTPVTLLPAAAALSPTGQIVNPFAQMNSNCFATSTPVSQTQAPFPPQTTPLFTPCMPQHETPHRPTLCSSCHECPADSSDNECHGQRERIPTLRPGQFDGTGAWKDFLYQFESCARANYWSEKTMAVQLRFSLTGAAGAIVHKNPRSARWSYQRIVDEMEAAYGPCSEHAAAVGIELRQRTRQPSESLHTLRDDIYERVSIAYADRGEMEQDAISVEIFTNALADAELVQKLLEEKPRTLARAYDIARRYEATRRAARTVTQLMRSGATGSAEQRTRAATVRESDELLCYEGAAVWRNNPREREPQPLRQWRPRKTDSPKKMDLGEVVCHNCSGVGHFQRNCPSPRRPKQHAANVTHAPAQSPEKVTVSTRCQEEEEMCVQATVCGVEVCALLDSGARRNVLPLHHYKTFPTKATPPIQPSTAEVLQGVGPEGLEILGEITAPVVIRDHVTNVNFIIADTAGNTDIILGHPFLLQAQACLDYGRRKITLFGGEVPRLITSSEPKACFVKVARRTVLEPGREYIVPGTTRLHSATARELMLSPTKTFVKRHHVLVAHVVVQARQFGIPIRVFNPGAKPVTLRKGVVAGILQPAEVLGEAEPHPSKVTATPEHVHPAPVSIPSHLQVLYADSCTNLPEEDCRRLAQLLESYSDVFSTGPTDLGRTSLVQHDILLTPGPPVKQQPRRMAGDKQAAADQQLQQSLEAGIARPSNSSWAAPIVMVRKKDKSPRLCVDYRPLNERTIKDAYPLPRIQDTLDTLSTAKYFSTLDLTSGYWQVELTPRARKAAAFCTRKGLFEWNVMPFGLCNAPATFQRLMDRVLVGLQWETCLVYLDDVIVLGRNITQMLERLSQVFSRLREANLKLKPSKCCLFRERVGYLGHVVSAEGIATDPEKVRKVAEWPIPQNVSEVRQFVGLASYYRRFVEDFATIAKPLHELTKKYARFHWTAECQEAFEELKARLFLPTPLTVANTSWTLTPVTLG